MEASSRIVIALLAIAAAAAPVGAAELCEACWEIGARGAFISPSSESGVDPAPSLGVSATFRFRPFWSVDAALDHAVSSIADGPDDSLTTFGVSLTYTFRAARDQRTHPYACFVTGLLHESIGGGTSSAATGAGSVTASSKAFDDLTLLYGIGAGGMTSLGESLFLKWEGRVFRYDTFGIPQNATMLHIGIVWKIIR